MVRRDGPCRPCSARACVRAPCVPRPYVGLVRSHGPRHPNSLPPPLFVPPSCSRVLPPLPSLLVPTLHLLPQTVAFRLMGPEMYSGMSALTESSEVVERGIALHKVGVA